MANRPGEYFGCPRCGYARYVPLAGSRQLKCLSAKVATGLKWRWACPLSSTGLSLAGWRARGAAVAPAAVAERNRRVAAGAAAVRQRFHGAPPDLGGFFDAVRATLL